MIRFDSLVTFIDFLSPKRGLLLNDACSMQLHYVNGYQVQIGITVYIQYTVQHPIFYGTKFSSASIEECDLTSDKAEKPLEVFTKFCKLQATCSDETCKLHNELRSNFRRMKCKRF